MNYLVIDVGTSSMRGVLYNCDGKVLYSHQLTYHVIYLNDILAEQNPQDWESALYSIIAKVYGYCQTSGLSISAISLTCQRSSIIPVDKDGTPLSNAIMWMDKRNQDICQELSSMNSFIFQKTGATLNTVFSGSKMTWVRRAEPEIYKRTYKFLTIADYLTYLMTGEFKTDHTYGGRSLLMNLYSKKWDPELLDIFEVDESKLCELVSPGSIIGYTTSGFLSKTGIPVGTPLISAGGDQQCAALGQGLSSQGTLEITAGTGAFILAYSDSVPSDLAMNTICGPHAIPGKYVLESSILSCASLYNWCINAFLDSSSKDSKTAIKQLNVLVENTPAGSNGCISLPFFQGRGTPDWNSKATGSFMNVTLKTTKGDFVRSILEAIVYELSHNINILESYLGEAKQIYLGGGLSRFSLFNQIQADVYEKELLLNDNGEQTALGAYLSAAVTMHRFSTYEEAVLFIQQEQHFEKYVPDSANSIIYHAQKEKSTRYYNILYK